MDEPLAFEEHSGTTAPGSGSVISLFANRLGSILTAVSISTGAVAAEYDYDAYGTRTQTGAIEQPYGFTGREHDAESGLIHLRARAYDPVAGVFVQRDPLGFGSGDINLYAYVWNDPLNWTDPSGLSGSLEYRASGGFILGYGAAHALRLAAQRCMAVPSCRSAALEGLRQGAVGVLGELGVGSPPGTTAPDAGSAPQSCPGLCGIFSGALGVIDKIGSALDELGEKLATIVQSNSGDDGEANINNEEGNENDYVGENGRQGGARWNTDLPGDGDDAYELFEEWAEGEVSDLGDGTLIAGNGVRLRYPATGEARVDIPATVSGNALHETIHFHY